MLLQCIAAIPAAFYVCVVLSHTHGLKDVHIITCLQHNNKQLFVLLCHDVTLTIVIILTTCMTVAFYEGANYVSGLNFYITHTDCILGTDIAYTYNASLQTTVVHAVCNIY